MSAAAFKQYILKQIARIESGNPTIEFYRKKFAEMSDKDIGELVVKLEKEEFYLPFYRENMNEKAPDIEAWLALAEELGAEIFAKLWVEDNVTGEVSLTPHEYWVAMLPGRRQLQYLVDKMTIAEDNTVRDALTGQVTGDSKGSSISYAQLNTLEPRGFDNSILEMVKMRGGDIEASRAYNRMIINTGGVKLGPIMELNSRPGATDTLDAFLGGMHFETTLKSL
jgi:hypothetical protein